MWGDWEIRWSGVLYWLVLLVLVLGFVPERCIRGAFNEGLTVYKDPDLDLCCFSAKKLLWHFPLVYGAVCSLICMGNYTEHSA